MVNGRQGWKEMGKLGGKLVFWHAVEGWAIEEDHAHLVPMPAEDVERFKAQAMDDHVRLISRVPKGLPYGEDQNVFKGRDE